MGIILDEDMGLKRFAQFILIFMIMSLALSDITCTRERSVLSDEGYYTCSMHPQVLQQESGECPICGMKLTFVPNVGGNNGDEHAKDDFDKDRGLGHKTDKDDKVTGFFQFSMADDLLQNAKVYTVPAKNEQFTMNKSYSGHIDYNEDPNKLVIITTKYDGWIEELYVSKEGQLIHRGELLMGVYSQKILAAMEEYITTFQSLKKNYVSQGKGGGDLLKDPTIVASRRKLIYLDVPASQISSLEKTGKAERLTYFRSPISGVLIKKNVLQGSHIKSGQELFRIANLKSLWVFIHIFEKDIQFIIKGQRVSIQTTAYPGNKFSGKIDLIYPFLDMKTRDIKVRIVVPNDRLLLKPGMYASVKVHYQLPSKVITVPEFSIIYSGEENYVFVSLGKGSFEVRPVVVLVRSGGTAIISSGLERDELVVANGQFLLDSEASLKEAMHKGQMAGHRH
ncbi:MAG: efflux RND transporter periplasmic adaptor subunit [Spirochaetota bacterium]|nr:efflux RND transporter periplasmic adaptor subunit [Spirochaetota bacterium]